eukprot:scaffold297900_cov17-Prasinocladus_malaysianus.AAC.1
MNAFNKRVHIRTLAVRRLQSRATACASLGTCLLSTFIRHAVQIVAPVVGLHLGRYKSSRCNPPESK